MTRLRSVLLSVGFLAAGAALLALTITLIVALSGGEAQARPQLIPASLPRPLPLRVPPKPVKPPLFSPFTREDDLAVLLQFGRPAFAWSGATPHLVPFIERARVADLYANLVGGYYRVSFRVAPHNLYASPRVLLSQARHASKARDIGFRFGQLPAGGKAVRSYSVSYPAASYTFRWSAKAGRWLLWMDGAPAMATEGRQLGGATVIIQYTVVRTSRFIEYGGRPPYAQSLGSGDAIVLRNGRAYHVRWHRGSADGGTTFTLASGKRMTFSRGQVWVVLAPKDHASFVNAAAV